MAEQKRHMDVPKERFLERLPAPDQTPESAGYVYQFAEKVSRPSYS